MPPIGGAILAFHTHSKPPDPRMSLPLMLFETLESLCVASLPKVTTFVFFPI